MVETAGPGFNEITGRGRPLARGTGIRDGLLTAFCRHTSASLTIQENADPDVQTDLLRRSTTSRRARHRYVHDTEGPDDMPAHIRAMLTGAAAAIPVLGGKLALGTWQGLYLVEHRDRAAPARGRAPRSSAPEARRRPRPLPVVFECCVTPGRQQACTELRLFMVSGAEYEARFGADVEGSAAGPDRRS